MTTTGRLESWDDICENNRKALNQSADVHAKLNLDRLLRKFSAPGYSSLQEYRKDIILAHGLEGRSVVHPCCNNGRELISMKNLGAGRCVGIDISDAFLEQAQKIAEVAKADCEFVRSDFLSVEARLDAQFDIAYISAGTLRCIEDIHSFFTVLKRLLKPEGWLFMHEMHPIVDMFSRMVPSRKASLRIKASYFMEKEHRLEGGLNYYSSKRYKSDPVYLYHHKLSDILQALIDAGFRLETIEETPMDISGSTYKRLEKSKKNPPLSFILTAVTS